MLNPHSFRTYNRLTAWIVFAIAAIVYVLGAEPTASFWDCGEYISCAYGLETGHPPGAPLFLLIGRIFSLFAFGDVHQVAWWINVMSGLASAFTIFFLYLSIVHLAKKIIGAKSASIKRSEFIAIISAGVTGALAYAFTDSFWFSAEEGEVYALSSLFTAIVFWAMLRWEEEADEPRAMRWIVFIFFLVGLSIGVHLLNLLVLPAVVFIYYFRKFNVTRVGFVLAGIVALAVLGFVQNGLVPGLVSAAGNLELWFVNSLHAGFHVGTVCYFVLLIVMLLTGLLYTHRGGQVLFIAFCSLLGLFFVLVGIAALYFGNIIPVLIAFILCAGLIVFFRNQRAILNIMLLSISMLIIGYSSFFVLVLRANAGTPINENNPGDATSMLRYLNREQYGDWPLLFGPYYNTPLDHDEPYVDGNPIYVRDEKSGRYIISYARKKTEPNYDKRFCTYFPRMWNSGSAQGYESYGHVDGRPVYTGDELHPGDTIMLPTFGENLTYFVAHQCGWLYFRYFGWNFIGRQNDVMGYGNDAQGNVITGIPLLDDTHLGDGSILPASQKNNKGRNRYFLLPILFGILGMYWHFKIAARDAFVILLLFLFTGLAIVFYLNQTPYQPRERDYAYVGSFYAFAIWIGMGALALAHYLLEDGALKKRKEKIILWHVIAAFAFSILVPFVLFVQNWDDHSRRGRTAAEALAVNFLNSCEQNAVLFTYADNDTFPLWYAQEVLGVRRDVRIVCLSLLRSDWYIDQLKHQYYTSDALPITMDSWDYREGTRDYLNIFSSTDDTANVADVVKFFTSKKFEDRFISTFDDTLNFIPSRYMRLTVNEANAKQHVRLQASKHEALEDTIIWPLRGSYILKDQMIILDFLAHNDWKRPVYFAVNMPSSSYLGLDDYLQLEGLAYHLVPIRTKKPGNSVVNESAVQTDKMQQHILHGFEWGGVSNPSVNVDETVQRMFTSPMRAVAARTAKALCDEGRMQDAENVIRKCTTELPITQVPPDDNQLLLIECAYRCGATELADKLSRESFTSWIDDFRWYSSLKMIPAEYSIAKESLVRLHQLAVENNRVSLATEYAGRLTNLNIRPYEKPIPVQDSVPVEDSVEEGN